MNCWGRRPILSFTQIVSGLACIVAGLISNEPYLAGLSILLKLESNSALTLTIFTGFQIFMSLVGKFGASASFAIIFVILST